ncbi:beta-ketoacyl-ACP synthase III [Clostridium sp. BJN0001]|uniref:beta-ketoacyl-ACP synthase III n=1 Tax=Clostridium sp. BJN0001 TaxID=2930219 RepID=UPI001FD2D30E|nr:beta-ketoacyl-ACP synthase III [Clostridium sp. BJN0001]
MKNIGIKGLGSYVPDFIVSNEDLSKIVDTDNEWIVERTGINTRRISKNEDTSDIAYKASLKALKDANLRGEDLDLIIVATISPDKFVPSVACILQDKLNAQDAACFDISVACSGFVYGIEIAKSMMMVNGYKNALVIGAEVLSKLIDWKDRSTCVLFGDGAGACILQEGCDRGVVKRSYLRALGSKSSALEVGARDLDSPFAESIIKKDPFIRMNGREVFKFAVNAMREAILKALEYNDEKLENIKFIIPHQANKRIITYTAKKLNLDIDKFFINIDRVANTSAASEPIALCECYEKNLIKKGDKIILVAFGGGLTYASTLIEW